MTRSIGTHIEIIKQPKRGYRWRGRRTETDQSKQTKQPPPFQFEEEQQFKSLLAIMAMRDLVSGAAACGDSSSSSSNPLASLANALIGSSSKTQVSYTLSSLFSLSLFHSLISFIYSLISHFILLTTGEAEGDSHIHSY